MDIRALGPGDLKLYEEMNTLFAEVFHDARYIERRPSAAYAQRLLQNSSFIALVALDHGHMIGALAAYELVKFEQETSEIYLYDLAVDQAHRRRGVATGLISRLQALARDRGAWVVFVQADTDEDDGPAIALYTKLGTKEEVLHFDLPVPQEEP